MKIFIKKSRTAAVLLTAAMVFGAGASPAAAAPIAADEAVAPAAQSAHNQQIIDVFNGINSFRRDNGLKPLRIGLSASAVAQEWSTTMATSVGLVHSTSHHEDMRIAGYKSASENIARVGQQNVQELVDLWIGSSGHRANMSRANDSVIGVGVTSRGRELWASTSYYQYETMPAHTYETAEEFLAAIAVPAVPAEVPVIEGVPDYQSLLSVRPVPWAEGTTVSYQWWAGQKRIEGATSSYLFVPSAATGKKLFLEVTARKAGYRETSVFSEPVDIPGYSGWVDNPVAPKITGTPAWGETLTVDPGQWEAGTQLTYQWDSGETGPTHVVEKHETRASVQVTGKKPGRYATTVTAALEIAGPKLSYSVKPSIKGTAVVGQPLTADPGTWDKEPSLAYTWLRNGAEIPGTFNHDSYTPTAEDLGAVITFSADVHLQGYAPMKVVSDPTAKVQPMPAVKNTAQPSISGTPEEGRTLTAMPGTWQQNASLEYKWLRDGQPVAGEVSAQYTLTSGDIGKRISLQVTGAQTGFTPTTVTTAQTSAVTKRPAQKPPARGFRDVPAGMQFSDEMNWMNERGIATGWSDNTYRPLSPVSRDAMSAFMYRLTGSPAYTAPKKSPFKDVVFGQEHYKEMAWLAETGVATGWPDRTYQPRSSVNRDAMAAFMYRLAGSPAYTPPKKSPFTDVPVSNQFYKEISWLASQGISTGWDQGNGKKAYHPYTPVNRDAMAAFMYRFDQKGYVLPGVK